MTPNTLDAHVTSAFRSRLLDWISSTKSFVEFSFLLALGIWSTFNEPDVRLWMSGVIAAVPAVAAVALWWSGRQLPSLPAAALMIVAGVGGGARWKIPSAILVTLAAMEFGS